MLKINPIKTVALATMLTAGTITTSCCQKSECRRTADEYVKSEEFKKGLKKDFEDMSVFLLIFGGIIGTGLAAKAIINYICETPEGSHQYGDGNHMGGD